jgi:RNA polymerase sigma-70 factor (ECF subfamily)
MTSINFYETDLQLEKNTEIFLELIERHKRIIYKIANSYCKPMEEREDLIQEIILQLWKSFGSYNEQYKLSTWIYRIALNTSISFYRKTTTYNKKIVELSTFQEVGLLSDLPEKEDSNLILLQNFIQELKDLDKAIILLYLDGLSQIEISEIIGITPSNVGTKINRIKNILRNKFKKMTS